MQSIMAITESVGLQLAKYICSLPALQSLSSAVMSNVNAVRSMHLHVARNLQHQHKNAFLSSDRKQRLRYLEINKNLTPVTDGRLMFAPARILLPIKLHKKNFTPVRYSDAVPNLVKIGPQIASQSCPQTPDGRTDVYVILYSVLYALHWKDKNCKY